MSTNTSSRAAGLTLALTQTRVNARSELWLKLHNPTPQALGKWVLHCDFLREIEAGEGTRVLGRVGSHIRLASTRCTDLPAGGSVTLCLVGAADLLQRRTDLPGGLFLETAEGTVPVTLACEQFPTSHRVPAVTVAGLVPQPAGTVITDGVYHWPGAVSCFADPAAAPAVTWLQHMLEQQWAGADGTRADIVFTTAAKLAGEAYRVQIEPGGILVSAGHADGFVRAAATLLQLFESRAPGTGWLPCQQIEDRPSHAYRGLMLDCARHFHSVDTLLEVLDWMARYKLNHFHWHLTDDEAWRLEICAFPQLTAAGAWRGHGQTLPPQLGSGAQRYGGFYSRADVATVVNAAAERGICVVPEIDIPGHCRAAIASLPQLLREPADDSAYTSVQFFNDNVLNPGLPGTYAFLEAVLDEVCALFPGPYVHMGGDEVPAGAWTASPACARLMAERGYVQTRELQGHLMRAAQDRLAAHGRTLIGWEEAIETGALDTRSPVCAWTGAAAVRRSADSGHPVISCPAPWAYLDMAWSNDPGEPGLYWAGTATLEECYRHLSELAAQQPRPFGVQGNVWCELIDTPEKLRYMVFPRLLAIAEWAWSDLGRGDWPEFRERCLGSSAADCAGQPGRPDS